jgi:hypothetical protein
MKQPEKSVTAPTRSAVVEDRLRELLRAPHSFNGSLGTAKHLCEIAFVENERQVGLGAWVVGHITVSKRQTAT